MRRYSPPYYSPPRRGYGSRGRSPPRRGYGGRSLLVRNIPLNCRPEDLRIPFERYGRVRDVYMPKDHYTGGCFVLKEPRGFGFVEFVDSYDASEAQYSMNGQLFGGRRITVVVAAETRKRPEEMRSRGGPRGSSDHRGHRSYYGRSRSRSVSRSRSPPRPSSSRIRYRSRSSSPAPRRRSDVSLSPERRQSRGTGSPRNHVHVRDEEYNRRSYSPEPRDANRDQADNGYDQKTRFDDEEPRGQWRSHRRTSRSPSGSRSRSADPSPVRSN